MGFIKAFVRSLSGRVATRVAEHDLFEKDGERVRLPLQDSPPIQASPTVQEGPSITLASLADVDAVLEAGKGIRIVNHWATWCSGCVEELPELRRLADSLGGEVVFVGVSWERFQASGGTKDSMLAIQIEMEKHGLSWDTLMLDDEVDPDRFFSHLKMDCHTIPQTWVVDDDGKILKRIETVLDTRATDEIIAFVGRLK